MPERGKALIPSGREYGARKQYMETARAGGVPLEVPSGSPPGVAAPVQTPVAQQGAPGGAPFHPLFDREPPTSSPPTAGLSVGPGPGPASDDPYDPYQGASKLGQLAQRTRSPLLAVLAERASRAP